MAEILTFHFEGALADSHQMNFYEASRFQYAAARLMVKLAQFRRQGNFVQKITNNSNCDINLSSHKDGSFNINIEDKSKGVSKDNFIDTPLSDLVAFVSERVVAKIAESSLDSTLVESYSKEFSKKVAAGASPSNKTELLDNLVAASLEDETIIDNFPEQLRDLITRRLAEITRKERLESKKNDIAKIDLTRAQKLIAMSAPLISEMATALRRSADTLEVTSSNSSMRPLLFLDQEMALEIETAVVDKDITPILGDMTQFNKDNGWGKLKIENGSKTVSFSIPSDILPFIRQRLIDSMKKDMVYLQTYFVRDRAKRLVRLIAVGVLPTPAS